MNLGNVNWVFWGVILFFLFEIRKGWKLGMIRIVFHMVSYILSLIAGAVGGPYVAAWLMSSNITDGFSMITIQIFAFIIVYAFTWAALWFLSDLTNLISKLPVIHGINKSTGVAAGIVHGLFILWFLCIALMLFEDSETGRIILAYIKRSDLLSVIYKHNILKDIIWKGTL